MTEEEFMKERRSIVGKIYTEQNINRDAVQATMGKIWRLRKPASLRTLEETLLLLLLPQRQRNKVSWQGGHGCLITTFLYFNLWMARNS